MAVPVHAETRTAQTSTTAPSQATATFTMQQLNERITKLPGQSSLKAGDPVMISDDGTVTGATWQGTYKYYPAGSVVPNAAMYLRWKDGLVALTPTPASTAGQALPGTLDANYVAQRYDSIGNFLGNFQTIQTLVVDGNDPSVWRIPSNAWLLRVNGSGQLTTLVDAFVFASGSQPVWPSPDGAAGQPFANGSQPVPVSAGYWQAMP